MRLTATILMLCVLSAATWAAVPPMINYQGKLMQPSGAPVPDGTYSMQFAIYDEPAGTHAALWSETNASVQVKGGLFSVLLGGVNNLPGNIFDATSRFFGVKVGADPEMVPRQQIASSAFAFRAAVAGTVDDGAITTGKLANGAVTTSKIGAGAVGREQLQPSEQWTTPALKQGWINYPVPGYAPAGYYKDAMDIVHLRGLVTNGLTNTSIMELPLGYRPSHMLLFPAVTWSGSANVGTRVDVHPDGSVVYQGIYSPAEHLSLDAISFRVDQ